MKNKIILTILAGILSIAVLTGCSQNASKHTQSMDVNNGYSSKATADYEYGYSNVAGGAIDYEPETWETGAETGTGNSGSGTGDLTVDPNQSRLLIRTVNMSVETKEIEKVKTDIEVIVGADGGYIESSNMSGTGKDKNLRTLTYTIRVPADQLDAVIAAVGNSCTVLSSNEKSVDVTLEYVDTKSRVESLRVEYNQLMDLLRNADDLDQIITLQNRLTEVRYQIESYESRLRVLENQVTYATLNLTIKEVLEDTVIEPAHVPTYGEKVQKQFEETLDNTKIFFENLGLFIIACLPGIIFLGINAIIVIIIIKSIKKKRRNKAKVSPKNPFVKPYDGPVRTMGLVAVNEPEPKKEEPVELAGNVAMPTEVTPVNDYQKPKYAEEIQEASTCEENKKEYPEVGLSGKVVMPEDRQKIFNEEAEEEINSDRPVVRMGLAAIHDSDELKNIPEEEPLDSTILIHDDKHAAEHRKKVQDRLNKDKKKKKKDDEPLQVANCDKEYMKEKHDFNDAASKLMNEDRANEDEN